MLLKKGDKSLNVSHLQDKLDLKDDDEVELEIFYAT